MVKKASGSKNHHLEEIIKNLQHEVERLKAVNEIHNLLGRYAFLHTAQLHQETVELFAKKTFGVRAEIGDWGVYEGIDGIQRLYPGLHPAYAKDRRGLLFEHYLTNPVIEVAGDGKTAKGIWMSPGIISARDKNGKLQAYWIWGKSRTDFVKEDGKYGISMTI